VLPKSKPKPKPFAKGIFSQDDDEETNREAVLDPRKAALLSTAERQKRERKVHAKTFFRSTTQ
jgi:deoxycytidine triphosphate deaminase